MQLYVIQFWDADSQLYRDRFTHSMTKDEARAWIALQRIQGNHTTYILRHA